MFPKRGNAAFPEMSEKNRRSGAGRSWIDPALAAFILRPQAEAQIGAGLKEHNRDGVVNGKTKRFVKKICLPN
jgi:hypothetical protein